MSLLECRELTKKYGASCALDEISFSIEGGKIIGLLGPNGSGKTTLIKIATGLLTPTSGTLLINGAKPGKESKKIVSYLPDRITLPEWMSPNELLNYYQDFFEDFNRAKALKMLEELGVNTIKPVKHLSKGNKEKVQLILAMSREAELYLLDEPIGGVDPATRDYILKTIISNFNPEASVIISTHLISDVEKYLDEVIFLSNGKIVRQATVDEIREKEGKSVDMLFREVFRC